MIPASLYYPIFLYLIIVLTIIVSSGVRNQGYEQIQRGQNNFLPALILSLILAIWIGMRPISGKYFGDTSNYAHNYYLYASEVLGRPDESGEWVWKKFMQYCSQVMDVSGFFTLVDFGYFGFSLWACRRLTPNNVLVSILFIMGAFSFFTYGTNGIRNGLACSIVLFTLSFAKKNFKNLIVFGTLAFVAYNIHHSTALPLLMSLISLFVIRSFKWACAFWMLSILVSLVAGGTVTSFFASLGFDDRVSYLQAEMDSETFRHTGFRFDFLIYSMMPIILGYYIIYRKGVRNKTYELLLNTYTLSNAFWVMVIRASYSNRFAYLSWFLFPLVLAYPLLKVDVWDAKQGKYLQWIMLAQIAFTWFLATLY